jgi:hypothetical protein
MKKKDDIRELLGRIRKLQNENHQIGLTSSKDVKKLLNENRNFLLKEENSDIQNVTPDEQREEESNFKGTVSKLVKFTPIKVYKQNVEWSGELIREKIKWVFSLNENNGCYISIESEDMLQLTTEVIETLKKLKGYYDVWSDSWGSRLTGLPTEGGETETGTETGGTAAMGGETGGGFGV